MSCETLGRQQGAAAVVSSSQQKDSSLCDSRALSQLDQYDSGGQRQLETERERGGSEATLLRLSLAGAESVPQSN